MIGLEKRVFCSSAVFSCSNQTKSSQPTPRARLVCYLGLWQLSHYKLVVMLLSLRCSTRRQSSIRLRGSTLPGVMKAMSESYADKVGFGQGGTPLQCASAHHPHRRWRSCTGYQHHSPACSGLWDHGSCRNTPPAKQHVASHHHSRSASFEQFTLFMFHLPLQHSQDSFCQSLRRDTARTAWCILFLKLQDSYASTPVLCASSLHQVGKNLQCIYAEREILVGHTMSSYFTAEGSYSKRTASAWPVVPEQTCNKDPFLNIDRQQMTSTSSLLQSTMLHWRQRRP